jgi:flagellar basal-body rod protein FlgF
MERGLFIAATGMLAAQTRLDTIAHRLANASNTGFKGERIAQASFGDMLLSSTTSGVGLGPLSMGSHVVERTIDLNQGALRFTSNPLDVAVEGEGWLVVQTGQGARYTRNGQLTTDPQGRLVTSQGDPVLGQNNQPIVVGAAEVTITPDGRVLNEQALLGQIQLVALAPGSLVYEGNNYLTGNVVAGPTGSLRQGALEMSNVNSVNDMVDLIGTMREFEANQRALRSIDETLERAANQVGRTGLM